MLAEVVAVEEGLGDAFAVGAESEGVEGHAGYGFEDYGVVGGFVGGGTPAERGVAVDEAGGDGEGVDSFEAEAVNDGYAGFVDVAAGDGFIVQRLSTRDWPMEVIGVGGA